MVRNDVETLPAEAFEKAATIYEQARPSYPPEFVDFMKSLCDKPDIIVDVGAGTGKSTRILGPLGAKELIAIEPVAAMRENLKTIPIITKIIDATAEHIPLEDNTVDIIISAHAFHWFATCRALAEFNRVLKPNGFLVLVWNNPDHSGREWAKKLSEYIDSHDLVEAQRYNGKEWKKVFDNQNYFSPLQEKQFPHKHRITRDLAIGRILSTSVIAILPSEQQKKVVDDVGKMLDDAEDIRGLHEYDVHLNAEVYWCSALKASS